MDNFDIVLFSPPSRMLNHYRPPLSLLYIGGYLTRMGLKVKIIDLPIKEQVHDKGFFRNLDSVLEQIYQKILDEFKGVKTRIAGITCYTPEYQEAVKLARGIKAIDNSVTVIAGGIHPTFCPEDFFVEDTGVDICVVGEGEITGHELCESILGRSKRGLADIMGIAYLDKRQGAVVRTPKRPLCEDLDSISYPDYRLIDMDYYTNASPYSIRGCYLRSMYLLATRGCPSQCTFCVAKKLREYSGKGNFVRVRSASSLIDDLKQLKVRYKIDSFYFIDDLFTIDKKNVMEFCDRLKAEGLDLLWGCSSKVSTLDEQILKKMAWAGCVQIDFGVERGSNRALQLIKKGITVEKVIEIFDLCRKYGIRRFANMLVNLPQETEEDLADILKLLDRLKPEVVYLNVFMAFPGTEVYEDSPHRLERQDYPLLTKDLGYLLNNHREKFRFATHEIKLDEWAAQNYKKYNSVLKNIVFYLSSRYWAALFRSRAKANYIKQLGVFFREFVNQKFNEQY